MPNNQHIVIISAKGADSFTAEQRSRLEKTGNIQFFNSLQLLKDEELIEIAKNADVLALTPRSCSDFGKAIFLKLTKLKGLAIFSTGKELIDLEAAQKSNVHVMFLKNYSTNTVAEHALACMLNFSRRLFVSSLGKNVSKTISKQGFELAGRTVGIIGMGKIGSRLSKICQGLDMKIIYADDEGKNPNYQNVKMEELLKNSDIIAMTASGNRNRNSILGKEQFDIMKKIPLLINVARSYLVDTASMISALKNMQISGYAVDDYLDIEINEEINSKILQTGHTAWYSKEAIVRGTDEWVQNIIDLVDQNNIL